MMVSKEEMKRVIKKTKKNEQWSTVAKTAFRANIEALMVYLAKRSIEIKEERWVTSQKRVTGDDVNAAFGEIWPKLFRGDTNE